MSLASLADAALYGHPNPAAAGASSLTAYSDAELKAFGVLGGAGMGHPLASSSLPARGIMPTSQLPGPGRHLQILDHVVHRIDNVAKPNGDTEQEMVVSNLRHFTLKIGVLDPRCGIGRDAELPLRAELLYENGQLVEQLATCEPLLVGKTEVVALQGNAQFKLRITSLSSHRDKQRFRIRVSPADTNLLLREPGLSVVTMPMKCVTKLAHRSAKAESGADGGAEAEGEGGGGDGDDDGAGGKRKRGTSPAEEFEPMLAAQGKQLEELQASNTQASAPNDAHPRARPPAHGRRPPALSFAHAHPAAPPPLRFSSSSRSSRASWWTWRPPPRPPPSSARVLAPVWLSSAPCPSEGPPCCPMCAVVDVLLLPCIPETTEVYLNPSRHVYRQPFSRPWL